MPTFVIEFYVRLYFDGQRVVHWSFELVLETWPVEGDFAHYVDIRVARNGHITWDHNVDGSSDAELEV